MDVHRFLAYYVTTWGRGVALVGQLVSVRGTTTYRSAMQLNTDYGKRFFPFKSLKRFNYKTVIN